jgi:hypothetical protein
MSDGPKLYTRAICGSTFDLMLVATDDSDRVERRHADGCKCRCSLRGRRAMRIAPRQ